MTIDSNITDLFNKAQKPVEPTVPNFHYTITLKSGETREYTGYVMVNSVWFGIAQGEEGVLMWAAPTSELSELKNNGPVTTSQ